MDIERELEILIDKHKGKQVGLGEIRLDWFAEDCLKEIRRLKSEIARQSVKSDIGETSDGYHTFNELYEHRTALFATLCNMRSDISWKSMKHADGTMYEGMFIAGIETPEGQYTYHCETKYWYMFAMTKEIDKAPAYDGHQPSDYPRLLALSENSPYHQSVKSEDVAEAIEQMEDALSPRYLESDGEWTGYNEFSTSAIRTAITALQEYQPKPTSEEVAISKTETTSEEVEE